MRVAILSKVISGYKEQAEKDEDDEDVNIDEG